MSFTLPAHRLSDTIRSATNFFFARVDSFDNSLSVSARVGGCDVVPDLSRSESAVTQQNVRKSFRIRTYDKPRGEGWSCSPAFHVLRVFPAGSSLLQAGNRGNRRSTCDFRHLMRVLPLQCNSLLLAGRDGSLLKITGWREKLCPTRAYVPCALMIVAVHPSGKATGLHPVQG